MAIIESQLEDFLFHEMFNPKTLKERTGLNLWNYDCHYRQVNLGPYGIADLVAFEFNTNYNGCKYINSLEVYIIELKAEGIGPETYLQAIRYAAGIRHFLKEFINTSHTEIRVSVCLVGKYVTMKPNDFIPINDVVNWTYAYTYEVRHDNLFLRHHPNFCNLDMDFNCRWHKKNGSQSFYKIFKRGLRRMMYGHNVRKMSVLNCSDKKEATNGQ